MKVERVDVLMRMSGDYVAYHEVSHEAIYIFGQKKDTAFYSKNIETMKEIFVNQETKPKKMDSIAEDFFEKNTQETNDREDYQICEAVIIKGKLYVSIEDL